MMIHMEEKETSGYRHVQDPQSIGSLSRSRVVELCLESEKWFKIITSGNKK